jgi:integrase
VAFEEHEQRAIFDPESLMEAKRPGQFWGPLLALYTGARLNELACLDLVDFVTERGIPCISIRFVPRAKPGTKVQKQSKKQQEAARSAKIVKNAMSRRQVPLHPDLWEIGLQDYIDDMRSIGATRLFPTLPADAKGKRERRLSHDGNEYLKRVGVHVNRQKVMHSFRDTVSDMLGIGDMDEFGADQWTGHAPQGIKAKHYRSKVAITIQAVEGFKALDFPFIDTERIQYRKGWWNAWTVTEMKP